MSSDRRKRIIDHDGTDGLEIDGNNAAKVAAYSSAGTAFVISAAGADGEANTVDGQSVYAKPSTFNDTSWDRLRGNTEITLLASAGRTATVNSPDQVNYNARGVLVYLDVSVVNPGGTDNISIGLSWKDPVSGEYNELISSAAITAAGNHAYVVYPGVGVAEEGSIEKQSPYPIPRTWRITVSHSGATDTFTYSVGASYVV